MPVHARGALLDLALRVDVRMERALGDAAAQQLDAADLDDAIAERALRPVVSVSRTIGVLPPTRLHLVDAAIRERIGALVLDVPRVPAHPVPLDRMLARQLIEPAPQVFVLHRLLAAVRQPRRFHE
jgi:hypothetical protein